MQVNEDVRNVLDAEEVRTLSAQTTNVFWAYAAAMRAYVDETGVLPLCPALPDMTAHSVRYTQLTQVRIMMCMT